LNHFSAIYIKKATRQFFGVGQPKIRGEFFVFMIGESNEACVNLLADDANEGKNVVC